MGRRDYAAIATPVTSAQVGACRKIWGQAAIAIGGDGSLAGWNFCPKSTASMAAGAQRRLA